MKYGQMTLATLKAITERAIISVADTPHVVLVSINFDLHDDDENEIATFEDEDTGHLCQHLSVCATVDEEETDYTLTWDTEDDKFTVIKNENEAAEWDMERNALFALTVDWTDVDHVIEMFGLDEINKKEVEDALDKFHKAWDAIDKNQDKEDLECQQNRVVCTCQLELRLMRRRINNYEEMRCNVNRQLSLWNEGMATTDEVMAELGIIRGKKDDVDEILNIFNAKLSALDNNKKLDPAEKQQKRWAIYADTRNELGFE